MKKLLALVMVASAVLSAAAINHMQGTAVRSNMKAQQYSMTDVQTIKAVYDKSVAKAPRMAFGDAVDTLYTAPLGTFFSAPFVTSDNYWSHYYAFMVAPNVPVTWQNASIGTSDATTYTWYHFDPATMEQTETDGEELTVTYPGTMGYVFPAPILTLNGATDTYYQLRGDNTSMRLGGTLTFEIESEGFDNLANPLDIDFETLYPEFAKTPMSKQSQYADNQTYWKNYVLSTVQQSNPDAASMETAAAVQFIDYGGAPYALKKVVMPTYVQCRAGAKVRLSVCRYVSGSGIDLENPIAVEEYVFEEDQEWGQFDIEFTFKDVDEYGLEQEMPIVIDGDIALVVDEAYKDDNFEEFRPCTYVVTYDADAAGYPAPINGYVLVDVRNADNEVIGQSMQYCFGRHYWGSNLDGVESVLPISIRMNFDVEYPFIYSEEPVDTLEFAVEGEAKAFDIIANKEFENLKVEAPEWLTVDGVDGMESDDKGNEIFTGNIAVTATAEAATEYREGYITISTPGAEYKVFCFQGEKGDTPEPLKGDVDGNGKVDGTDLNILINIILGKDQAENYEGRANVDEDANNGVDGNDLNALINILLGK